MGKHFNTSSLALLSPTQRNCDGIIVSVHTKTDTRRIHVAKNLQRINRKMHRKDKDKAGTNKKRHSRVGNGKDKD